MTKHTKKLVDITEDDLKGIAQARRSKRLGIMTFAVVALPVVCAINFILAGFILPKADISSYRAILLIVSAIGLLLLARTLIKIHRLNWTGFLDSAKASILLQSTNVSFEKRMSQTAMSSGIKTARHKGFATATDNNELLVQKSD